MVKKILVVVDSIDENAGSGAKANIALIINLNKVGYIVKVYHYSRKEIVLEGVTCVGIAEQKWNLFFILGRLQRLLARWTGINLNKVIENAIGFSFTFLNDSNSIKKAIKDETTFKPDLVLTLSQAASFRPHHALLKMPQWHSKWMAYVHDPYPFHCYPKPYDWYQDGYKQKEHFFYQVSEKATYSAFPSLLLKEWMGQFFPKFLQTGKVIPHQLVPTLTNSNQPSPLLELGKFVLLHAGSLLKQRDPKGLLEGYKLFLQHHPEALETAELMLVGAGGYHDAMLKEYATRIPSVKVISQNVPFDQVLSLQSNVSVNIILEAIAPISPFLPGKFPHCVMANKPILSLAPNRSETHRLLGEEYPYWSEQDDVERIAHTLGTLYEQWKRNPEALHLNRPDLITYLGHQQLQKILDTL
jgi:hypothetical protein